MSLLLNWIESMQSDFTVTDHSSTQKNIMERNLEKSLSRRDLLTTFQIEGKHLMKNMVLSSLGNSILSHDNHDPENQFFSVNINQTTCTLCGACVSVCSHEVFTWSESKLILENGKCINCTFCRDVCPETAIEIVYDVRKSSKTIHEPYEKKCTVCRRTFLTFEFEKECCPVCQDRDPEWLSPYE